MEKYLYYEDFGAKGDGVTDDLPAIVACHEEANRIGATVKAKDGATYYIGTQRMTAVIKTSVDFGTAKFIIDDRDLEDIHFDIFSVQSDFETFDPGITELKRGQKKVDIPHEGNIYVRVFNDNHKIFIREGLNMNNGTATTDCFLVDADGNVTPSIDWDYEQITMAWARRIDDEPITISGGTFVSIANQAESFYNYHYHGMKVERANVTICGLTHLVEGELDHGAPYRGFIEVFCTANVITKDCVFTPHFIYWTESKIPGKPVAMGSYDINAHASINLKYINVKQTVDINDTRYWGIYTSNFAKDMYFENCTLSRFDAHQGVTNITLKGCTFGHQGINLIGFGEAHIEDCEIRCYAMFDLRGDYGALWHGNVTIKNCYWNVRSETCWSPCVKNTKLFSAWNKGLHNFGFTCYMPTVVTIDGLRINDESFTEPTYLLPDYRGINDPESVYPYQYTKKLIAKGVTSDTGKPILPYKTASLFADTEIVLE